MTGLEPATRDMIRSTSGARASLARCPKSPNRLLPADAASEVLRTFRQEQRRNLLGSLEPDGQHAV